ncbi:NAD(P)-binding domain [Phaffia rhodozyma]|uniref:NAD(P)-binding domain n=1 Tax=Phaffia rhodozyma TaxID=264483 RepID=A0A0F7SHZ1_PHARH|nr:NAD(P)-binding domain [Phaffia rhodozyma]
MSTAETQAQKVAPSVFLLGASGYIGGAILAGLIHEYPKGKFYVQYRRDEHKSLLEKFSSNIEPVKATLQDGDILKHYASIADVVVSAADCDDVPSAKSLIAGLEASSEKRKLEKKLKAVYIHTSGTGVLVDGDIPAGEEDNTVYDDSDLKQIEGIAPSRPHREVDIIVTDALERGHFLGYIVLPSTIYGIGNGPIHTVSQQIPNLVNHALTNKRSAYIEPGKNVWSNVHIDSLTKLYVSLIKLLLSPSAPPPPHHGFSHYIFGTSTSGPHSWKDLSAKVGDILYAHGLLSEGGSVGIARDKYKGPDMGYSNKQGALQLGTSVGKSVNGKELVGWEDTEVVWDWLDQDVMAAVKEWNKE